MRQAWASLLAALCLVMGQQGALLHELGHHLPVRSAQAGTHAAASDDGVRCDLCFAFEHIACVMGTACATPGPLSGAQGPIPDTPFARRASPPPEASARGPPASWMTPSRLARLAAAPQGRTPFPEFIQKDDPCSSPPSTA